MFQKCSLFYIKNLNELEVAGLPRYDAAYRRFERLYCVHLQWSRGPVRNAGIGYKFITPCNPFWKWFFLHLTLNKKGNYVIRNLRGPLPTDSVLHRRTGTPQLHRCEHPFGHKQQPGNVSQYCERSGFENRGIGSQFPAGVAKAFLFLTLRATQLQPCAHKGPPLLLERSGRGIKPANPFSEVKVVPNLAMKADRGSGPLSAIILNFGTRCS